MRFVSFDVRRRALELGIEFDNAAAALGLYLVFFPFATLMLHIMSHLIIVLISVAPVKYRKLNIEFRGLPSLSKSIVFNAIMLLTSLIALYYITLNFLNAYYPFWSKLVVCVTIFVYFIRIIQMMKERTCYSYISIIVAGLHVITKGKFNKKEGHFSGSIIFDHEIKLKNVMSYPGAGLIFYEGSKCTCLGQILFFRRSEIFHRDSRL
ncbi:hypothetical protein D3C77_307190 [compost metagenome]